MKYTIEKHAILGTYSVVIREKGHEWADETGFKTLDDALNHVHNLPEYRADKGEPV